MFLRNLFFIAFFMLILFSFQCKKANHITPGMPCFYTYTSVAVDVDSILPRSCSSYYWPKRKYPASRYQYYRPCFNPNNPNQIAYMRWDTTMNSSKSIQLYTFDFCTGEKRLLDNTDSQRSIRGVDWGYNDTILYAIGSSRFYRINPDGQGNDFIVSGYLSEGYQKPSLNYSGNKFIYKNDRHDEYVVISDIYGMVQDTIHALSNPIDLTALGWNKHNEIAFVADNFYDIYSDKYGIYTFNLNDTSATYAYNPNYYEWYGEIENLRWFDNDEKILFQTERSICATTPGTNIRTLIRAGFDNRIYKHIDISPDGKTILTERVERIDINGCYIKVDHALYLMNIDGTDERRIELPE